MPRMTTGELAISLNGLKEKHDECEERHDKLIEAQKARVEQMKKGIYDKIENVERECKDNMNDAILQLKSTIKNEIIDPLESYKKAGIKIFICAVGVIFSGLVGFIVWLLNVSNVIGNLEKLLGG